MTPLLPSLANHLESFFRQHLAAQRQASPTTIATYRDGLRLFLVFAAEQTGKPPNRLTLEDLDRNRVLAFLTHLEKERGNTVRTRNARLAVIRSFFKHVAYRDPAAMEAATRILAIPGKRMTKRVLTYLREEELDALLAVPDRTAPSGRRDHVLLLFMARTGARVSPGEVDPEVQGSDSQVYPAKNAAHDPAGDRSNQSGPEGMGTSLQTCPRPKALPPTRRMGPATNLVAPDQALAKLRLEDPAGGQVAR